MSASTLHVATKRIERLEAALAAALARAEEAEERLPQMRNEWRTIALGVQERAEEAERQRDVAQEDVTYLRRKRKEAQEQVREMKAYWVHPDEADSVGLRLYLAERRVATLEAALREMAILLEQAVERRDGPHLCRNEEAHFKSYCWDCDAKRNIAAARVLEGTQPDTVEQLNTLALRFSQKHGRGPTVPEMVVETEAVDAKQESTA